MTRLEVRVGRSDVLGLGQGRAVRTGLAKHDGIVPARQAARNRSTGTNQMNRALISNAGAMPFRIRRPQVAVLPGLEPLGAALCAAAEGKLGRHAHGFTPRKPKC